MQAMVVDREEAYLAELGNLVIGNSEVDLDGLRSSVRSMETNEGNLIADSRDNRDEVVAQRGLQHMIEFATRTASAASIGTATWALANFYRFGAEREEVTQALPLFARLLFSTDAEIYDASGDGELDIVRGLGTLGAATQAGVPPVPFSSLGVQVLFNSGSASTSCNFLYAEPEH